MLDHLITLRELKFTKHLTNKYKLLILKITFKRLELE